MVFFLLALMQRKLSSYYNCEYFFVFISYLCISISTYSLSCLGKTLIIIVWCTLLAVGYFLKWKVVQIQKHAKNWSALITLMKKCFSCKKISPCMMILRCWLCSPYQPMTWTDMCPCIPKYGLLIVHLVSQYFRVQMYQSVYTNL